MHWLAYIALIWVGIYLTAIFIAFLVKFLLPIPPIVAAASGLIGGLIGVFYVLIKQAEHPVEGMIDGIGRPKRPETNIGDLVGEEDFGGIIEELRDQDHGERQGEDGDEQTVERTRQ